MNISNVDINTITITNIITNITTISPGERPSGLGLIRNKFDQ